MKMIRIMERLPYLNIRTLHFREAINEMEYDSIYSNIINDIEIKYLPCLMQ